MGCIRTCACSNLGLSGAPCIFERPGPLGGMAEDVVFASANTDLNQYLPYAIRCCVHRKAISDELARPERQLVEVAARIQKLKALLRRLEAAGENTAHAGFCSNSR